MDKTKKLTADFAKQFEEAFSKPEVKELLASMKDAGDTGTFRVLITNEAVDRAGEMIKADGWELEPYMKSPVVLWGHDYKQPPIGITLKIVREGTALIAEGKFAPSAFAQEIRQLYDMGIQRAASVGFIPKEMEGNIITKAELLEWSFVAVPCNSEALSMLSIRGVDVNAFAAKGIISKEEAAAPTTEAAPEKTPEEIAAEATAETTDTEKKGEVEDQLDAEAQREIKYNNMSAVYEVLYAFCDVYYNDETPAEDFGKLLGETADLFKKIADGTYTPPTEEEVDGKSIFGSIKKLEKSAIEAFAEKIKRGGKADEKVVADIELAKSSAQALIIALEGLSEKTDAEGKKTTVENTDTQEAKDFLFLRGALQDIASVAGDVLADARKRAVERKLI